MIYNARILVDNDQVMSNPPPAYTSNVWNRQIDEFRNQLPRCVTLFLATSSQEQTAAELVAAEIERLVDINNFNLQECLAIIKLLKILEQSRIVDTSRIAGTQPRPSLPPGTIINKLTVAQMDSITKTIVDDIMGVLADPVHRGRNTSHKCF
jgi:hypothetical protein